MIKEPIQKSINDQIQAETFSSYLYLQMAAWLESKNLKGMANWMRIQTQEEVVHSLKFYQFLLERGGEVKLQAIEQPQHEWNSPLELFEAAMKHEQYITDRINKMVDLAIQENDHATRSFLQWYVDEQVEEEANAEENVLNLKMVGDHGGGLMMVDQKMGQRVFTMPVGFAFTGAGA